MALPSIHHSLADRWSEFRADAPRLADIVSSTGQEFTGPLRRRTQRVAAWLSTDCQLAEAAEQPDRLEYCVSWLEGSAAASDDDSRLRICGQRAATRLAQSSTIDSSLWLYLLYPWLLATAAWLVLLGISIWLVPLFAELFEEFGIELPDSTQVVLGLGGLISTIGWLGLVALALVPWIFSRLFGASRGRISRRQRLARWSDHWRLLLSSGMPAAEALAVANRHTHHWWLQANAARLLESPPAEESETAPYPLLAHAIATDSPGGRIALLKQTASLYRSQYHQVATWCLSLLGSLLLLVAIVMIWLIVLSLFLPLVAIVSGLTGGGPF